MSGLVDAALARIVIVLAVVLFVTHRRRLPGLPWGVMRAPREAVGLPLIVILRIRTRRIRRARA